MTDRLKMSRRVQAKDFEEPWFVERTKELAEEHRIHRKLWEFCVIAQTYKDHADGGCALGFGVGREPLAAWIANREAYVTATDRPTPGVWDDAQHVESAKQMKWKGICKEDVFDERVHFIPLDMNAIPRSISDIGYDFTWSSSSMEHLGSIEAGIDFFCHQMKCLRPGGIAAHTTEFNALSNHGTLRSENLVVFRQKDLKALEAKLKQQGDTLWPLDLTGGLTHADLYVDEAPYIQEPHLSLKLGGHTFTSVLLVAERGNK